MNLPEGFTPARVVYLGTPEIAVAPLRSLVAAGVEVALVVTAADRRRGRGGASSPTPVKVAAVELGLAVTDDLDAIAGTGADLGVVVAYGRILRAETLALMPFVNLHFSLLPRWRGAAPVERAILAGDAETGVALMAVDAGLDTGDVYAVRRTRVDDKTLAELWHELSMTGGEMLVEAVTGGFPSATPQTGDPLHAAKLTPSDRHLDWSMRVDQVLRVVRLGDAWATVDERRLKVWSAERSGREGLAVGDLDGLDVGCADGSIRLIEVQPEGRARQPAADWARGRRS